MRNLVISLLLVACCTSRAAAPLCPIADAIADSATVQTVATDTATAPAKKRGFWQRVNRSLDAMLRSFSEKDTNYIEPQHYHFAAMVQHTQVYQYTRLKLNSGNTLTLSPDVIFKLGPYFGWKWVFLGYTVDVKNLFKSTGGTYIDLSLYSNQVGLDVYYIDNGDNFKIRHFKIAGDIDTGALDGEQMVGLSETSKGFNLYYITNHHKFSYPAAFSQSTRQKRSAASALVGIGYSHHKIGLDYQRFLDMVNEKIPNLQEQVNASSEVTLDRVYSLDSDVKGIDYRSFTLSGGWGYNWVLTRNLLLAGSLQGGLSYNVTDTEYEEGFSHVWRNLSFENVALDFTARLGFVYNNDRWFTGFSAIMHNYNYRTESFRTRNFYGTINIYAGVNFDLKKRR